MEIISKESTESTNDDVAELALKGYPHLTTVVAKYQTRGRGRRGNKWEGPPGNCLLFSTLIRCGAEPLHWRRIPQIAGMELIHTVEQGFGADGGIKMKWPNDLYYYDKKWCGILVESKLGKDSYAVLGMGVNCLGSSQDYPEDLRSSITTLEEIFSTSKIDPVKLLKSFLDRISQTLEPSIANFGPVVDFANRRDYLAGKKVSVLEEGRAAAGIASGIGSEGELILEFPGGDLRRIFGGTILEIE